MQTLIHNLNALELPEFPITLRPIPGRRRDVVLSWSSAILLIIVVLFLQNRQIGSICLVKSGAALFCAMALLITFSYWSDKQTSITLNVEGIAYTSPFRKVYLQWPDIQVMVIYPAGNSWRISIRSEEKFFTFSMPLKAPTPSDSKSIIGFPDGHIIAGSIIESACLHQQISQTDDSIKLCRVSDEQDPDEAGQPL